MNSELLTEEEVREWLIIEYDYLELTDDEIDSYVKFIMKIDRFRNCNLKTNGFKTEAEFYDRIVHNFPNTFDFFNSKFNQIEEYFKERGYDSEQCILFAKYIVVFSNKKALIEYLDFIRALGMEKEIVDERLLIHQVSLEKLHARKCYLSRIGYSKDYKIELRNLFKINDNSFEKKFNTNTTSLYEKYPVTEEVKNIWAYLSKLKDNDFYTNFKLSRKEMAAIYPTTTEELATLKTIANMTDEEIIEDFGITRKELLEKRPINKSTLTALKAISKAKEKTIQNAFHQSKDEVLHLRTITVEMINAANQKIRMQHAKPCSKEELMQMFKQKKKGTNPNG